MDRFTISLNEDLARQFDELIHKKGYQSRSREGHKIRECREYRDS